MRPKEDVPTAPRSRRGARLRRPAAIATAVAAGLAFVSLAAASAPAGSAAEPASVEASAAASMLGGGPGGILGVGPGLLSDDPGQPLRPAARTQAAAGRSGDRMLRGGRPGSRGRGFVRDARGFADVVVPGVVYRRIRKQQPRGDRRRLPRRPKAIPWIPA